MKLCSVAVGLLLLVTTSGVKAGSEVAVYVRIAHNTVLQGRGVSYTTRASKIETGSGCLIHLYKQLGEAGKRTPLGSGQKVSISVDGYATSFWCKDDQEPYYQKRM